jgi:CubicO group peptidase (beta-lactamase class C family)
MVDTAFDRSDQPRRDTAINYLESGRTNVLHLPVRGAGDGGAVTTARDLERLWAAMFDGRILPMSTIERLVEPRNVDEAEHRRYGLGFWVAMDRPIAMLEGMDAGISARTAHDPGSGTTYTVLANTSSGAWPIVEFLDDHLWASVRALSTPG